MPAPHANTKRNVLINMGSQIGIRLLSFYYISIVLANYLGPAGLGQIAFAFAVFEIANALTDMGCNGYILREIPQDKTLALSALKKVTAFRFYSGIILYGFIALYLYCSASINTETRWVTLVLCLTLFLNSYNNSLKSLMIAFEEVQGPAMIGFFVTLGGVGTGLYFKSLEMSLYFYTLALVIWVLPDTLVTWLWAKKKIFPLPRGTSLPWKKFLSLAVPLGLNTLFFVSYYRFDTILLKTSSGNEEAGIYNAALRLVAPIVIILLFGLAPLAPVGAELFKKNKEKFYAFFKRWLLIFGGILPLIALSIYAFAPFLIEFLYDGKYSKSITLLQFLSISLYFQGMSGFLNIFLAASNPENTRRSLTVIATGLSLNIFLFFTYFWQFKSTGIVYNRLLSDAFLFLMTSILAVKYLSKEIWKTLSFLTGCFALAWILLFYLLAQAG